MRLVKYIGNLEGNNQMYIPALPEDMMMFKHITGGSTAITEHYLKTLMPVFRAHTEIPFIDVTQK